MVTYESQPSGHWVDAQVSRSIKSQIPSHSLCHRCATSLSSRKPKDKEKTMVLLHSVVISWQASTLTVLFSEMSKFSKKHNVFEINRIL
jgi:hypothetical protein